MYRSSYGIYPFTKISIVLFIVAKLIRDAQQ